MNSIQFNKEESPMYWLLLIPAAMAVIMGVLFWYAPEDINGRYSGEDER